MLLEQVEEMIRRAGGGENALAYAEALHKKVNCIQGQRRCARLISQLCRSREPGDFRGRVLEVNFAYLFARKGIILDYGIKQGMSGDIDFCWEINSYAVNIELKLLGQDINTRTRINSQLATRCVSAEFVDEDTKDVARLQRDILQKASTQKFNSSPAQNTVNLVAIDVTELQLGAVDICDCLLAAGGNMLAAKYFGSECQRESVVGVFEDTATSNLRESQRKWVNDYQHIEDGSPHPRTYLHGVLFLFRDPPERAALSYDFRRALVWNPALTASDVVNTIESALDDVILRENC